MVFENRPVIYIYLHQFTYNSIYQKPKYIYLFNSEDFIRCFSLLTAEQYLCDKSMKSSWQENMSKMYRNLLFKGRNLFL